ncbi:MAG: PAS domain-containing sensor histidine kinase [Chloroflexota bacterium]
MRNPSTFLLVGATLGVALVIDVFLTPDSHLPLLFAIPVLIAAHRYSPRPVVLVTVIALAVDAVAAYAHGLPRETTLLGFVTLPLVGYIAMLFAARREQAVRWAQEADSRAAELAATLAAIPHGIVVYDVKGAIVRMNPGAEAILGYPPDVLRRPLLERSETLHLQHADLSPLPAAENPAMRALRGETVRGLTVVLHPPAQASERWVVVSAAPVRDAGGEQLGAVMALTDITAEHAADEAREAFVRAVSHDLRQPLTVVQGQAQLLRSGLVRQGAEGTLTRGAEAIAISAQRMNTMIQELVDTARLETKQLRLDLRPLDLRTHVADLVERLRSGEGGNVRIVAQPDLPAVLADPTGLDRVLGNLLGNAFKYAGNQAAVSVTLCRWQDGTVGVSVSDDGPGIAAADLPHLFERYYRADVGDAQRRDGLGLGLYIAKGLVEANGGRIWAESAAGNGATFTFTLPTAPAHEELTLRSA